MKFSHNTDTDSYFDNEINNDKTYEPKELNDILLGKIQQIANTYQELSLIGDINNFKKWNSGGCGFDITMDNSKVICKAWNRNGFQPNNIKRYVNTRCIITGWLKADYYHGHRFHINVNSIKLIHNDTKLKELKSICKTKEYFENKKKVEYNSIKKIGIISKQNTQGYDDFCSQFKVPLDITLIQISLEGEKTSSESVEAIKKLQDKDLIIIIRGGGDTIEISNSFDVIELFDIIKKSNVPIATAIGHEQDKGDKLLITNVADIDFPTPTACAKDLNNKFYNPLIQKILDVKESNEHLFNDLLEKKSDKLYRILRYSIESLKKSIFGGQIIKVDNNETNIIIEKNGKYYKINLNFKSELKLKKQDINIIDDIENALDEYDIDTIKENYNKLNIKKDKLSTDILDNIKKIEKNQKIEDKFQHANASKIAQYYLTQIPKTADLNKLIKIKKLLLWYKEQIGESMDGKDIDEIKDIYNFIKNIL